MSVFLRPRLWVLCYMLGDHLVLYVSPLPLFFPLLLGRGPGVSHGWLVNRGFSPLLFDCFLLACFSVVLLVCFQWRPPTLGELLLCLFNALSFLVPCFCWCFVSLSFVSWRATVCLFLLVAGVAVCFVPVLWWVCVGGCLFFRSSAC